MVWLGSGLLPLLTSYIYNNTFQPKQLINNSYAFLLEKRQATVQIQSNQSLFNQNAFVQSKEFENLQNALKS